MLVYWRIEKPTLPDFLREGTIHNLHCLSLRSLWMRSTWTNSRPTCWPSDTLGYPNCPSTWLNNFDLNWVAVCENIKKRWINDFKNMGEKWWDRGKANLKGETRRCVINSVVNLFDPLETRGERPIISAKIIRRERNKHETALKKSTATGTKSL